MKRQGGFTLIELVVVIVILGILAVTAAPKFLNLQGDARKSSLQGLKGAMSGAAGIVYGKAAIEGKETNDTETVDNIAVVYGYPAATSAGIVAAVVGLSDDWSSFEDSTGLYSAFKQDAEPTAITDITNTECYVKYQTQTSASAPSIEVTATKC
jgi:MSHA pilin protein MshA